MITILGLVLLFLGTPIGLSAKTEILTMQSLEKFKTDVKARRSAIEKLVMDAITLFKSTPSAKAFDIFTHDTKYQFGSGRLFVLDTTGLVYVPEEPTILSALSNIKDVRDNPGAETLEIYKKTITHGLNWITYPWRHYYKTSFIASAEKDDITYIFGLSFYPIAVKEEMVSLVDDAVNYFNKEGRIKAWHAFDDQLGSFVRGGLYLYAYDLKGTCVAHGNDVSLVGKNLWNLKEDNGVLFIQELIKAAENGTHWVPYKWFNAPKDGYATKVTDTNGDNYIIGSGYYPDSTIEKVAQLVDGAVESFDKVGREKTISLIEQKAGGPFTFGDLFTFMYDLKGNVLADGDNPAMVGKNILDLRSPTGEYVVRKMIDVATVGSGLVEYEWKNSFMLSYIHSVSDASGAALIGCGIFPYSKRDRSIDLVRKAIAYFETHERMPALIEFGRVGGPFLNGDLQIFVIDANGSCLIWGDDYDLIWRDIKKYSDGYGHSVYDVMVKKADAGGGWIEYKVNNTVKLVYVRKVNKDNTWFLIGTGYYKYEPPKVAAKKGQKKKKK